MASIEIRTGNALLVEQGILVHGCNCQGVMGSGFAHQVRSKWPDVYEAYRARSASFGLQLGDVICVGSPSLPDTVSRHIQNVSSQLPSNLIVANAMTQFNYGRDKSVVYANYAAIFAAFARLSLLAWDSGLPIHFPLIGCGLANGTWDEVALAIESAVAPKTKLILWTLPS